MHELWKGGKINYIGGHRECLGKNQLRNLHRGAHTGHGATKEGLDWSWCHVEELLCKSLSPFCILAWGQQSSERLQTLELNGVGETPEEGIALKLLPSTQLEVA